MYSLLWGAVAASRTMSESSSKQGKRIDVARYCRYDWLYVCFSCLPKATFQSVKISIIEINAKEQNTIRTCRTTRPPPPTGRTSCHGGFGLRCGCFIAWTLDSVVHARALSSFKPVLVSLLMPLTVGLLSDSLFTFSNGSAFWLFNSSIVWSLCVIPSLDVSVFK